MIILRVLLVLAVFKRSNHSEVSDLSELRG